MGVNSKCISKCVKHILIEDLLESRGHETQRCWEQTVVVDSSPISQNIKTTKTIVNPSSEDVKQAKLLDLMTYAALMDLMSRQTVYELQCLTLPRYSVSQTEDKTLLCCTLSWRSWSSRSLPQR